MNAFPVDASAQLVLQLVRRWLEEDDHYKLVDRIVFNLYTPQEERAYGRWVQSAFPLPTTLGYGTAGTKRNARWDEIVLNLCFSRPFIVFSLSLSSFPLLTHRCRGNAIALGSQSLTVQ
jgi:hypothetical protein